MDEFQNACNRIKKYFEDLEEYHGLSLDKSRDYYAASMITFSIINESLKAAEFFMSKKGFSAPETYKGMMDFLLEKGIINAALAGKMKLLITTRNLISHEYGETKPSDIARLIGKIGATKDFISALSKKY